MWYTSKADCEKRLKVKQRTLIIKQWNVLENSKKFSWEIRKNQPFAKLFLKRLRNNQVKNGQLFKPVVLRESKLFMRVWSWLRMNAGGVLNTCKSNEALVVDWRACSKRFNLWLSGGRVSNAWVTCLIQGDNSWKRLLIPHKRTVPHGTVWKTPVVWDGPASD